MSNTIDLVDDWKARLRSRLYVQFKHAASWIAWCDDVLGPQFDDLERAGQTLLTLMDVDDSEGVQLDNIGRHIGQPRNGVDDATYRLYLSARVLANKSDGTVEDIFKVMRALFGQAETLPTYQAGWVKQFAIRIGAVLTRAEALIATGFLGDAKEAGARGILEWSEYGATSTFAFYNGPVLATGINANAFINQVYVNRTDGTPTLFGYLNIRGLDTDFFYASRTATCFHSALGATMTMAHPVGSPVNRAFFGHMAYSGGASGTGFDYGHMLGAKQA
jgi:hypothetical protein